MGLLRDSHTLKYLHHEKYPESNLINGSRNSEHQNIRCVIIQIRNIRGVRELGLRKLISR